MAVVIVNPPNIAGMADGFRAFGSTFPEAIADLVDNSIDAKATAIDVQVVFGPYGKPGVSIADNGCGMDLEGLVNATRWGGVAVDDAARLGRFGLGLKTASYSFCRRLTLVSTPGGGVQEMFATSDLDVIQEENEWLVEGGEMTPDQSDAFDEARDVLAELVGDRPDRGTLVIWDKVDRLLVRRHGGEYADPAAALRTETRNLREHLALVFQRYLDPDDDRARTVVIAVNGEKVMPRDPFCERWEQVQPELHKALQLERDGEDLGQVIVRGFILPHKREMDDLEYVAEAAISLANQGVYVYRENRMVCGSTWLQMFFRETFLNHLRIDISYLATHDDYLVTGAGVRDLRIEPGIGEEIWEMVRMLRAEANSRSRRRIR